MKILLFIIMFRCRMFYFEDLRIHFILNLFLFLYFTNIDLSLLFKFRFKLIISSFFVDIDQILLILLFHLHQIFILFLLNSFLN